MERVGVVGQGSTGFYPVRKSLNLLPQGNPSSPSREGGMFLFLGGTRSGKSSLALAWSEGLGQDLFFLATARASDMEMEERIRRHRGERSSSWKTLEWNGEAFPGLPTSMEVALLDSVTLLASDLLIREWERKGPVPGEAPGLEMVEKVTAEVLRVVVDLRERSRFLVVVGDEVGMGLVPPDPLGRAFRDLGGSVNQELAHWSDQVFLVVAGLPLPLKREGLYA